ncbi:MAG: helix-hairpin-helix domain-containing protein [Caldimonas sp.]
MIGKIFAALAGLQLSLAALALDVNTASQADLEAVKGIGPALSTLIVDERRKGSFENWPDLIARVRGLSARSAERLSAAGLTVKGAPWPRPP